MRIGFLGNQGNNAYRLCKWVRALGEDAELFLLTNKGHRSLPEQVDRSLADGNDPPWLHRRRPGSFKPSEGRDDFTRLARDFDAVVTSGRAGLLLAPELRDVPIVHLSLGSEVTTLPHRRFDRDGAQRRQARQARRALHHVDRIVSGFRPSLESVVRLGLGGKLRIWGYPDDIEDNRARVDETVREELMTRWGEVPRLFLWLSRIHLGDPTDPVYKGADLFLRAAARLLEKHGDEVRLVVGEHGDDIARFQQDARELGIEEHIDYVPHMEYWRLLTHMSLPQTVIFDEIDPGKGELSGIAREGLSVGSLVCKTVDPDLLALCFGTGCPVRHAESEQECLNQMESIVSLSPEEFADARREGHVWARRHLHWETVVPRFIDLVREAIYCRGLA